MTQLRLALGVTAFVIALAIGTGAALMLRPTNAAVIQQSSVGRMPRRPDPNFELDVMVNGRPVAEYYASGRTYVEALKGAEYELRLRNPSPERVAVALSVDGLNTIDARHTSAWNASKWVIEPYQTITISGWQMSTERARHFYFTNERDSYGAKLGQTANLGIISAVFFRERRPRPVTPPYPITRDRMEPQSSASAKAQETPTANARRDNDEYAATGIGRDVRNDVRWVDMDLESNAAGEVNIRYEFYPALLRLGVIPRRSREDSRGFSPEP
jgi:hypothetical protein